MKVKTLNLKIRPNEEGLVKVSTKADTTAEVLTNWYKAVYKPTDTPTV